MRVASIHAKDGLIVVDWGLDAVAEGERECPQGGRLQVVRRRLVTAEATPARTENLKYVSLILMK